MTQIQQLAFDDPRLRLRVGAASTGDALTRSAMLILDDMLDAHREKVLSAPSVGIPVRLLSIKRADRVQHLLNPRLTTAGEIRMNRGEHHPQTGPLRRNVWRARKITLTGQDLSGRDQIIALDGDLAIQAQQGLDLFDKPRPFDWITGSHMIWLRSDKPEVKARFANMQAAFFAAPDRGDPKAASVPIRALGSDRVEFLDDAMRPAGVLDALHPLQPVAPDDQALLAAIIAMTTLRSALWLSPMAAPVIVSLLSLVARARVRHAARDWPRNAFGLMGLVPSVTEAATDQDGMPLDLSERHDIVVLASDHAALGGTDRIANLRRLGKALNGHGGALFITAPDPDAELMRAMSVVFPAVATLPHEGGVILIGVHSRPALDNATARVLAIAGQHEIDGITRHLAALSVSAPTGQDQDGSAT
ncbi:peptide deformylase [Paracoccus sp. NSM]|uniref:peptide deformylase n=1 Tax=Paracoccus sp. NSM TaxID=3457784 RepID=UPI004036F661